MRTRASVFATCALMLATTGCGGHGGYGESAPVRHGAAGTPVEMAAAYTGPDASYAYRLVSTCGERTGLGTFDVIVRRGQVVHVRPVDRWSRIQLVRADIPTLDGFVTKADQARSHDAETVQLTMRDGHVDTLSIDWDNDAMDDEFCWRATHVRPL